MASYYCYECLRKFNKRKLPASGECPGCKCGLRTVKNRRICSGVVTRLARLRGIKPPTTKSVYEAYLASKEWKAIRGRVLERDGYRCYDCGHKANQVHHLSYAPEVMAGNDDSQLMSLCRECHRERHPEKRRKGKHGRTYRRPYTP